VSYPRYPYLIPKKIFYNLSGWFYSKTIPRFLEKNFSPPDVIHAGHIYLDGYGILPFCRVYDLPFTVVAHGWAINNYQNHKDSIRDKIDAVLRECDCLLCVSEALQNQVQAIAPETPTEVVPLGADPNRFPTEESEELRASKGINGDQTIVLFSGQFLERKGVPLLVDAIQRMNPDRTQFVLVGHGGHMKSDLLDLASESDNVFVHEGMSNEELSKWFSVADLFLLPSYSEGRPTAIYEAMASETAVLATRVGGIPEQVEDGVTGVLIPPGDSSTLQEELERLTADKSRLKELGLQGKRRLIEKGWTWEDHAKRLKEIHGRIQ
jgi:glycosyltransferase involved in cell wall biosynthesis